MKLTDGNGRKQRSVVEPALAIYGLALGIRVGVDLRAKGCSGAYLLTYGAPRTSVAATGEGV